MTKEKGLPAYLLRLAARLYGLGVWIRNKLFDRGLLPSKGFRIPVINIGNIAVGGTGKTPHVEYLIRLLQAKGYRVATLSRGYKRHTRGYVLATLQSNAREIGDEPCQMKRKFPDVQVAVHENRCRGIERLMRMDTPPVDVILLDDAFQHRYVHAGLNLLLTDYHRLFCDDDLMPMGRLREPASGARRAQIVIVTKCPCGLGTATCRDIASKLHLQPGQQLYFSTLAYGDLRPLIPHGKSRCGTLQADDHVLVVAGIASPARLMEEVKRRTPHATLLDFGDHHEFTRKDILTIGTAFNRMDGKSKRIVITEKDAVRLIAHPGLPAALKREMDVLPVEVKFLQGQQTLFNQTIIDYVTTNPRDRNFPAE